MPPFVRRRRARLALLAVAAFLLVAAVPGLATGKSNRRSGSTVVAPWVQASGTGFFDQSGNPVYLRGFNANSSMGWKKAAVLGANFVRIPVYWSDLEPNAPVGGVHTWVATQLAALDAEVQLLQSQNINVLIDFHQTGWSPYFTQITKDARGMPAWLYGPGYFPQPMTQDGLGMAKKDFATNPAILPYYQAYVQMLVKRYSSYPNVVGYELYNEPQPGKLKQTHTGTQALIAFQAQLLQFVRSLDPQRTVFVSVRQGGNLGFLNADLSAWGSLANVAIDLHDYFNGRDAPYGYSADTETWYPNHDAVMTQFEVAYVGTEANQLRLIDQVLAKTNQWGVPLLVGEWGARVDDPGLLEYQRQMLNVFRLRKLNWTRWALTSHGALRILNSDYTLSPAALQIQQDLQKPY
jgi:aryl-phospho-beta-D-glucosidase BglC (GH1 family)